MLSWQLEQGRRIDQSYFARVAEILVDLHRYQQATRDVAVKPLRLVQIGQPVQITKKSVNGKPYSFRVRYGFDSRGERTRDQDDLTFLLSVLENVCNKPYFRVSAKQAEWIKHIIIANLDRIEPLYAEINEYRRQVGMKPISIAFENLPRKARKRDIDTTWDDE
jgi:hypothetical protein